MKLRQIVWALRVIAASIVAAATLRAQTAPSPSAAATGTSPPPPSGEVQQLSEFYVTSTPQKPFEQGANLDIPRTSDDVQPYTIINREAIEETGNVTLAGFLEDELTQDTSGIQNNQKAGGFNSGQSFGTSQINLRGLGNLQTLILVNGSRIAENFQQSGDQGQNVNQIPLDAIDHIEVMPSSASAIYGASAVGGVINIILKKNYTGGEIDVTYQNTFVTDNPQRTLSLNFGFPIGKKTQVGIFANFSGGKSPVWQDRPFVINNYYRVLQNSPSIDFSNTLPVLAGGTPNIVLDKAVVGGYTNPSTTSLTLKNGTSLNSLTTYIPYGTSPSTSVATLDAGLLANAGQQNFNLAPSFYRGTYQPIIVLPSSASISGYIDHEFTPMLEGYARFDFNYLKTYDPISAVINVYLNNTQIAIPGNSPFNPFQQNVQISLPLSHNYENDYITRNNYRTAKAGLIAHLPGDWTTALAESVFAAQSFRYRNGWGNFQAAADQGNFIADGAFNPFVDTVANPQGINTMYGTQTVYEPTEQYDFNLRASGHLAKLPGGKPMLTVGMEARSLIALPEQWLYENPLYPNGTPEPGDNYIYYPGGTGLTQAAYGEVELPMVAPSNQVPLLNTLEIEVAGRAEQFNNSYTQGNSTLTFNASPPAVASTIGRRQWSKYTSANPTMGFKYKPVKSLTFRGSFAMAFVPPTFAQLTPNYAAVPGTSAAFVDPKNGQTYTTTTLSIVRNPDLLPQRTRSYDAGMIWEPDIASLHGLRVDLEYYKIYEYNLIQTENLQRTVNDPALAGDVIRDPTTGLITEVIFQDENLAKEYTDGWDLTVDYRRPTSFGSISLHAGGTVVEHLKEPTAISEPLVEYVGFLDSGGVVKTKVNATLTFLFGQHWTMGWHTNYFDGYKQQGAPSDPEYNGASTYTPITTATQPQGGNYIPSELYHNVFASYRFGTKADRWHVLDGMMVTVGVNDLFNTAPPFDANTIYQPNYEAPFGTVLLRTYVLRVKKEF